MNTPLAPIPTGTLMTTTAIPPGYPKAPTGILMGAPGAGKTWSVITMALAGIECFIIITEPNGLDSLLDAIRFDRNKQPRDAATQARLRALIHWHVVLPKTAPWGDLVAVTKNIASMDFAAMKKMKAERRPEIVVNLLESCNDFIDDTTGKHYGDVTKWPDTRALFIDSLSGLNDIFRQLVVGLKPSPDQGEWGVMVDQQHNFLYTLLTNIHCYCFILAHLDRGMDEANLMTLVTPSAMTKKYSGKVGKDFGDVICAKRADGKFYWSTIESGTDLKNRALPLSEKLDPDFKQIVAVQHARVETWKKESVQPQT